MAADVLSVAEDNRGRCNIVLATYGSALRLVLSRSSDAAAQERMLALIDNPRATLTKVRSHVQHAFRRMYRQRNIVVHGGEVSGTSLEVALRTAAPLVGAALDRMAHAQLVDGVSPLALAARAEISLELVGTPSGKGLAELLE